MVAVETSVPAKECTGLKEEEITKAKEVAKEVMAESVQAINLLAQGKRNMLCGQVSEAVTQLQEACRLLAKKHGETADQCGEAYLAYGTALLDLSRMESGVLGNALEGAHLDSADDSADEQATDTVVEGDKITEEEREKISDQVIEAMTEERPINTDGKDFKTSDVQVPNPEVNEDQKELEKNEMGSKSNQGTEESMETENATKETDDNNEDMTDEDGEDEECTEDEEADDKPEGERDDKISKDEEDVTNLQLAWEVLELAKLIFNRQNSKEIKLKGAEAHLKLGEVGIETAQYDQAIEDLNECLKIQQQYLEPESRLIAETHYQIGIACVFSRKYHVALENLRKAVCVINAKLSELHRGIEEEKDPSVVSNIQKEIRDLKEILPDIMTKIEDTEEEMKSQDKVKEIVKDKNSAENSGFVDKDKSGSVNDIGHLVRKKRNSQEKDLSEDSKKAKIDAVSK